MNDVPEFAELNITNKSNCMNDFQYTECIINITKKNQRQISCIKKEENVLKSLFPKTLII